jgi:hypothetical protein
MAAGGVDQRARQEAPAIEGLAVTGEGQLVLGSAFDVLDGESRNVAARYAPQLLDVQRATKVAAGVVAATRGGWLS